MSSVTLDHLTAMQGAGDTTKAELASAESKRAEAQAALESAERQHQAAAIQRKAEAAAEKAARESLLERHAADVQQLQAEIDSHRSAADEARAAEASLRSVNSRSTLMALKSAEQQHKVAMKAEVQQVLAKDLCKISRKVARE